MVNFVVYNKFGQILRTGTCPKNMVAIQAGDGEYSLIGNGSDRDHKVINGKVVSRSPEEINELMETEDTTKKSQERRRMINSKGQEIIDRMAIEELKKEGKL